MPTNAPSSATSSSSHQDKDSKHSEAASSRGKGPNRKAGITDKEHSQRVRLLWWNVEHLTPLWHQREFWQVLAKCDVAILTETHHTNVPEQRGWQVIGNARNEHDSSGGVLILVRVQDNLTVSHERSPFDGFLWITINNVLDVGGCYIPGPSDIRFRSRQGDMHADHFQALTQALDNNANHMWLLGGDFNSITGALQPPWSNDNPLDFHAPDKALPARTSDDLRS
eukprot:7556052-Karenia_brevis.AAC.1